MTSRSITLIHTQEDQSFAAELGSDLEKAGFQVQAISPTRAGRASLDSALIGDNTLVIVVPLTPSRAFNALAASMGRIKPAVVVLHPRGILPPEFRALPQQLFRELDRAGSLAELVQKLRHPPKQLAAGTKASMRDKRVLLFESDAEFAQRVTREFESLGATVAAYSDGESGLLDAMTRTPDLILLAVELPRMNGFLVCKKLRKEDATKSVPLVIISSESEDVFQQHANLRTRADRYVKRPVEPRELAEHGLALLGLSPGSAGELVSTPSSVDDDDFGIVIEDDETDFDLDLPDLPSSIVPGNLLVQVRLDARGHIATKVSDTWSEGVPLGVTPAICDRVRKGEALPNDVERIGQRLFEALKAAPQFADLYAESLSHASEVKPLRLVLQLLPDEADPSACSVADLFWEMLHDADAGLHLGISAKCRLLRRREGADQIPAPIERSLPVVVGFSSPIQAADGTAMPTLNLMSELSAFRELERELARGDVLQLRVIARLGLDNFGRAVNHTGVFHYSGHGRPGVLELQSGEGRGQPLEANALRQALSAPTPRLVVLNSCRGAASSAGASTTAGAFLAGGVRSVIAMMGDFQDHTALKFTRELYLRIANGETLEDAVQKARWRLFAERAKDWFMPSLWTSVYGPFSLVAPAPSAEDGARVSSAIEILDRQAERLHPRVAVVERLARIDVDIKLSAIDHEELVDRLAERLCGQAENLEQAADELVQDQGLIEELSANVASSRPDSPLLRQTLTAVQVELLPQLQALASSLPALTRTLSQPPVHEEDSTSHLDRISMPTDADDPPLALPPGVRTLDRLIPRVAGSLVVPRRVVERCVLNLLAGRHLVLTGPPGTGKSTLAENLARAFGFDARVATANPDWTTFDVIGGLFPVAKRDKSGRVHLSYTMRHGCVTDAVSRNWTVDPADPTRTVLAERGTWLVLDEMNRAPMDQAFGDLFTGLVSGRLSVPRVAGSADQTPTSTLPIPKSFRIIGTLNTADRHLLFEMSEALKRRFAFVEVPAFEAGELAIPDPHRLIEQVELRPAVRSLANGDTRQHLREYMLLLNTIVERIRVIHPLGTAQVVDALTCCFVGGQLQPGPAEDVVASALPDQFAPLLESQAPECLRMLAALLEGEVPAELRASLRRTVDLGEELTSHARGALRDVANYCRQSPLPGWSSLAESIGEQLRSHRPDWNAVHARLDNDALAPIKAAPGAEKLAVTLREIASRREH